MKIQNPILFVRQIVSAPEPHNTFVMVVDPNEFPEGFKGDWTGWLNGTASQPVLRHQVGGVTTMISRQGPRKEFDLAAFAVRTVERTGYTRLTLPETTIAPPFFVIPYHTQVQTYRVSADVKAESFADMPSMRKYLYWSTSSATMPIRGREVPLPYVNTSRRKIEAARTVQPSVGHHLRIQIGDVPTHGVLRLDDCKGGASFNATLYLAGAASVERGVELTCRSIWRDWHDPNKPTYEAEDIIAVVTSVNREL